VQKEKIIEYLINYVDSLAKYCSLSLRSYHGMYVQLNQAPKVILLSRDALVMVLGND
jgi:hypothetical protein